LEGNIIALKDELLKEKIYNTIYKNNPDKKLNISVNVERGWVVLSGFVENSGMKQRVIKLSENIHDPFIIIDKIAIIPSMDNTDNRIASNILNRFDENSNINVDKITVIVNNRKVELEGNVPTWKAKEEAIKIAESINEVESIKEKIKVSS
jgi:osmotically-inducible protein OsmY